MEIETIPYAILFWIIGLLGGFIVGVKQVSKLIVIDYSYQSYVHEQKEKPVEVFDKTATFTAYNSVPEQTDSSPCHGASGINLCEVSRWINVCATRLYPLGTVIEIEGHGLYTVLDKTSLKYANRIDIFMDKDIKGARQFGIKQLKYRLVN